MLRQEKEQIVESRDRRFGKSIAIAMSSEIYQVEKETYRVESESIPNRFYIVRFMDGSPIWCSCKDWEIRSQVNRNHICKHQRAIVLAENYGLIKKEDESKQEPNLSFKDDEYSF